MSLHHPVEVRPRSAGRVWVAADCVSRAFPSYRLILRDHHHGTAPRSRDIVRAPSRTYDTSSARGCASSQSRSVGPEIAMAPTATPCRSRIGAAHDVSPSISSSTDDAQPCSCTCSSSTASSFGSVIVQFVKRGRRAVAELRRQVWVVGEQHLAHRGGMHRQQRTNLEHLRAVVRAEHVMHQEHLTVVQRAETHALVGARRQPVRPVERSRAQLVAVEVAAPQVEQGGADAVLARTRGPARRNRPTGACA